MRELSGLEIQRSYQLVVDGFLIFAGDKPKSLFEKLDGSNTCCLNYDIDGSGGIAAITPTASHPIRCVSSARWIIAPRHSIVVKAP